MIQSQDIQVIQDQQRASIARKTLVDAQLEMIYHRQWFNIWVPKRYSGLGLSFTDGLRLLEELAYWDGSMAWTVTLCSGANMFAGFIDEQRAREVFADPKVCFGGSGRVGGRAVWDGQQYRISGEWQYATGAPHLSHFTLNAYLYDGDEPQLDENGNPVFRSFFVPKDNVLIHYDWDTFGLESTASHSFSLVDLPVAANACFQLDIQKRVVDEPLFRIPFAPFAEATLLVNYLGMYRRFLDLVHQYFMQKSKDPVWAARYSKTRFQLLDSYQSRMEADRATTDRLAQHIWQLALQGDVAQDHETVRELAICSRTIVKGIREAVTVLFPLVGIRGAQRDEELNIVFRNIFTATQHSLLNL